MKGTLSIVIQAAVLASAVTVAQDASPPTFDVYYNAVGNGIIPPKAVYSPSPHYTNRARKKKIQGSVVVGLIVTAEGNVREPKVVTSLDKDLDEQALVAVATWKFEPATKDGKPVSVHANVSVTFALY